MCLWLSAVFLRFILGLRYFTQGTLGTFSRGTFLWRIRRNPSLWDDAVSSDVCDMYVIACHLLLGIRRLSKFGKCDPWQILRIYFFQNFKISKIGFLANFFTFFLKNGAVFLWTHVQSWNCGEIMRGCLMKCIFLVVFQKSQNWIFGDFFYESLVKVSYQMRLQRDS